jgi:hypothetical protein
MPTDTAPIQMTATVITSGAEAIRTARDFAASIADGVIERDRAGLVPVRELAALDTSGASAADERYDLSRHWRNARTHANHDPVAWKYHHIGNYLLNDVHPPNHGQV